ncbi:MAG: hypothetical protein DMD56_05315 [Gemmatimonadetes bacterium]|nr:MAG: hypothetical protein DMD56_05315 [Gemmatimonadota bacterium]
MSHIGIFREALGGLLGRGHRAPAVINGAPQPYQRRMGFREGRGERAAESQPQVGALGRFALTGRRPPHGEAGERGAQRAEHCRLHQSMSHATRPPGPARPPPRPLAGRRIAVTRAREQAAELVRELEALGAQVVVAPTIRISPLTDLAALRAALTRNPPYDWIVFTSQNAVHVVCDRLPEWQLAPRDVARAAVAAIGPATAEALVRRGVVPDLVPDRFVAEAVVTALAAQGDVRGKTVLLPRARGARDALPDGLRALGARVDVIPVYETIQATGDASGLAAEILAGAIDAITFTSSSTVRGFVESVGRPVAASGRFAAAVIGPVTAGTARELGIAVAVEAAEYTVAGLVEALVRYFGR